MQQKINDIFQEISIDRSEPLDLEKFDPFVFKSIEIGRYTSDGKLNFSVKKWKIIEEDEHSLQRNSIVIPELEFAGREVFKLENTVPQKFKCGEQRLSQLRHSTRIRNDVKIFEAMWSNRNLLNEKFAKTIGKNIIIFDGSILKNPAFGAYHVIAMLYHGKASWSWTTINFNRIDNVICF